MTVKTMTLRCEGTRRTERQTIKQGHKQTHDTEQLAEGEGSEYANVH